MLFDEYEGIWDTLSNTNGFRKENLTLKILRLEIRNIDIAHLSSSLTLVPLTVDSEAQ